MALLPSGQTYNWYFNNADQITNITYDAKFYGFKSPDSFHIIDGRNGSSTALSFSANNNGDWFFNKTIKDLFYLSKTLSLFHLYDLLTSGPQMLHDNFDPFTHF
ncbi:hypothetical protein XENOCAPTIV_010498 [Xenoophorus captivus]|uniref:Uncharacterized protein n=1 Tax=Xenoophorus captivus TaxID=1517983 RepID=A0ABV0QR52_9TELE